MPLKLALGVWYERWEVDGSKGAKREKEEEDPCIQIEPNHAKWTAERAPGRPPRRVPDLAYWLIVKSENGRVAVLTLQRDGEAMLPVFSHEEEAEMFLRAGDVSDSCEVKQSGAEELVSLLHGPCAGVKEVALDPLPEMVEQMTIGLVSLLRECFIEYITARRSPIRLSEPTQGWPLRVGERARRSEEDQIITQYPARRLA